MEVHRLESRVELYLQITMELKLEWNKHVASYPSIYSAGLDKPLKWVDKNATVEYFSRHHSGQMYHLCFLSSAPIMVEPISANTDCEAHDAGQAKLPLIS